MLLKLLQKSQESTCVGVSFLIKLSNRVSDPLEYYIGEFHQKKKVEGLQTNVVRIGTNFSTHMYKYLANYTNKLGRILFRSNAIHYFI